MLSIQEHVRLSQLEDWINIHKPKVFVCQGLEGYPSEGYIRRLPLEVIFDAVQASILAHASTTKWVGDCLHKDKLS